MDIETMRAALEPLGLRLRTFGPGPDVLNLITDDDGREMTRADVDAFRALLAEHGLAEAESWVARQGVSWLSDGVFAGVSFRVRPA